MSQAYSGVQANIIVGATDLDVQGWNADVIANTFDSTTTADLGWDDETPATKRIEWTFDFFYAKTKPPFGTLGLVPGSVLSNMNMYINKDDDIKMVGTGLVKKVSLKVKVKDGFILTASGMSKGPWVLPT